MTISKKIRYVIIMMLSVALVAVGVIMLPSAAAIAEEAGFVKLSPVKTEGENTYFYFDNPLSVYADGEVKIVSGQNGIYFVSESAETGETEISHRVTPADKVYRRTTHQTNTEYLIVLYDGKISVFGADEEAFDFSPSVSGDIVDFTVWEDKLFAVTRTQAVVAPLTTTGIDSDNAFVSPLASGMQTTVTASKVTAMKGKLYVSIKAVFGNKWDVGAVDISELSKGATCRLENVLNQSNEILSLTASDESAAIYTLTRSEIVGYTTTGGGLRRDCVTDGSDITDIFAYGDSVYTLDALNGLHVMNKDLSSGRVIVASASAGEGFFNVPYGIAAKNSTIYVADTVNNRVAIYSGGNIQYISREFRTPVSVAADNGGTLYVAYDDNKVGIFHTGVYTQSSEYTVTAATLGMIRQITVDADKKLYILSDTGLWWVDGDYNLHSLTKVVYDAITLSIGKNNLYALSGDSVVMIDKSDGTVKNTRTIESGAVSIAVDLNDTVFALYRDKIVSVDSAEKTVEFALTLDGEAYTLGDRMGKIVLCFMENGLDEETNNYAIILDTFRHRILKADGNSLNARFVDTSYESPDIVGSADAADAQNGIIYKVRFDTALFDYPIETKSDYTLHGGGYVIMPDYSIVAPDYKPEETPEFALVLVDDTENNRLIQGYVYRDALTKVPYTDPPSSICTVTGELGIAVYKWPSRNAKPVSGYAAVAKNTKFPMLDFVQTDTDKEKFGLRDGRGYYWYRIQLDDSGKEGYVLAIDVITTDYKQANILPDYNAEIVAYKGIKVAKTYDRDASGNYHEVSDVTLKAGTKVEVVGAFDSSERYTKIKFLDEKTHKTVTCYVETVHLKYTGLNIVLIVALIVIAVTVTLAVIIISRVYYSKKKRLNGNDEEIQD
ncbi:MAG: hypothetical protein J1F71_01145 [Clostridiales bacterium]|nr:hypothetical protein [Clostridiales bacterium]